MAYEILSESYGARLPKITATADSTDDLVTMGTNYAEGSTCVIGDKTYALDKVQGWVEPGSGGGGGGSGGVFWVNFTWDESESTITGADKSVAEIMSALESGALVVGRCVSIGTIYPNVTCYTDADTEEKIATFDTVSAYSADSQVWATGNSVHVHEDGSVEYLYWDTPSTN